MTLDEALEHWRRERGRLEGIEDWVDAGKPKLPPPLQGSFDRFARLSKTDAKKALKALREELAKDCFLRLFSAFEGQLRVVFSEWLRRRCGATRPSADIEEQLPAIDGVLRIAAVLEPRFDSSRVGYISNVREKRNKLVHGGFAEPIPYDLETLHGKLAELLALFAS